MEHPSIISKLRGAKIYGIASFDLIGTGIGAYMLYGLGYGFRDVSLINVGLLFIILIIIAVYIHWILKIPTMLNYYLGFNSLEEVLNGRKERGEIS
jgi:hypothetical protein